VNKEKIKDERKDLDFAEEEKKRQLKLRVEEENKDEKTSEGKYR
jgi:hypothetical protein